MNQKQQEQTISPETTPELFDDYDFREPREATPESEDYYQSLMAMMSSKKRGEEKPD